jgi:NAD(P)-dependent dehydrogenase (short-subunit alcohol dehydrogenase family)
MQAASRSFGPIDLLFANAGISECPDIFETSEAFFDEVMYINIKGVFYAFVEAFGKSRLLHAELLGGKLYFHLDRIYEVASLGHAADFGEAVEDVGHSDRGLVRKVRLKRSM